MRFATLWENRIKSLVSIGVGIWLSTLAAQSLTRDHHFVCDQEIQTRDGAECVGDLVMVDGPSYDAAFIWGLCALIAFHLGIQYGRYDVLPDPDET
jgi:hypothetical protein